MKKVLKNNRCVDCSIRLGRSVKYVRHVPEIGADYTYCPCCGDIVTPWMQGEYYQRQLMETLENNSFIKDN